MSAHKRLTLFDPDRVRANLLPYTRKAFRILPPLVKPRILDIGCGTGVSTLELAQLSEGTIVGVDIEKSALNQLVSRANEHGLSDRIKVVHTSMLDMDFPPNYFDIIWSEGSIKNIGFKRGLNEWRDFLVLEGFLVVHDEITDLLRKIELIGACGYTILEQFELPPDIWWRKYYAPLQKQIETARAQGFSDEKLTREMKEAELEIKEFDRKSDRFGSVFFILKKA